MKMRIYRTCARTGERRLTDGALIVLVTVGALAANAVARFIGF